MPSYVLGNVDEQVGVQVLRGGPGTKDQQVIQSLEGSRALDIRLLGDRGRDDPLPEHLPLGGDEIIGDDDQGAVPGGRVIPLAGDEAESAFRVEPAPGSDPREAIFRACAGADLPLLDMHYDAVSLEDVFLRLTDDQSAETKGGEEE